MTERGRVMAARCALVVVVLGGAIGCGGGEPEPDPPAAPGRAVHPTREADRRPQNEEAPGPSNPASNLDTVLADEQAQARARQKALAEAPAEQPVAPAAKPTEPERDYEKELRDALGSPVGCLQARTAKTAAKSIELRISAVIMGSGAVSRADVHSAQLSDPERQCVKRLAESVRIASPTAATPLKVNAGITLEQAPAEPQKGK